MENIKIDNQKVDCYYDDDISKYIVNNILSKLKRFELEKNKYHRPKRNHFLYWEDSCYYIGFEDEISLCIELHFDNEEGVEEEVLYIMKINIEDNCLNESLEFKSSNLPTLYDADYIFTLRQLMTVCYNDEKLMPQLLKGVQKMKREMSFRNLGIE